ncbi:MAG: site-2 protease family protein [Myxococcota bacterium]
MITEWNPFVLGAAWYLVFLLSTVLHEAAHAWVAKLSGDSTGAEQVTLDPIPHIRREPFGMVLVPLLTFFTGGWMMGWASVPYDPTWANRYPRKAAWMAAAGPAANLLLVVLAAVLIRVGMSLGYFQSPQLANFSQVTRALGPEGTLPALLLSIMFSLNLLLFVFNLLPMPPLDGSGVITLFMREETAVRWQNMMAQPALALLGILIAWRAFDYVAGPVRLFALNLLYPGAGYH